MSEAALAECPECHGELRRLIGAGAGLIIKGGGPGQARHRGSACSLEHGGRTCCGRDERCSKPPCQEGQ